MVWALILTLVLAMPAYAEDGIEVIADGNEQEVQAVELPEESDIPSNDEDEQRPTDAVEKEEEEQREVQKESGDKLDVQPESRVDGHSLLAAGDRASVRLVAYGNMSPNNAYALYAEGLLKEVGQNEQYALVQDSNQSYTLVVGKADSLQSFTDARWWRWYGTTGYGWRLERGSGTATVEAGQYQVISSLEGYPSLVTEVQEVTRREVMLYAMVASAVFSLVHVWAFCIRLSRQS